MKNTIIDILKKIIDGILAGILIALGGAVYLACIDPAVPYARYIGAFFFSTALLCICIRGYSLYTGKIGYVLKKHSKNDLSVLLLGLLGNAIGTIVMGYLIAVTFPAIKETAFALCTGKLAVGYHFALVRAIFCGILVYLAVDIYRENHTVLGIVFCIPVFILSGYEHSIADIFYFATSGIASIQAFGYLWIIIAGNSIGALVIPLLKLVGAKKKNEAQTEQKTEADTPSEKEDAA